MDLKPHVKRLRDLADYHMLLGIKWARLTYDFPPFVGALLADVRIAQLEAAEVEEEVALQAAEAEEEVALQAAINKAGAFA